VSPDVRIFAGELAKTTLRKEIMNGSAYVPVSPSGACCSSIFISGALTRVDRLPGESLEAWVSDPTGTFLISTGRQDSEIKSQLELIEPPVFVTVRGEVQVPMGNRKPVHIRPVDIRVVDRTTRDSWVIRTAEITLARLESIEYALLQGTKEKGPALAISHYSTDREQIKELVRMVEEALLKVNTVKGGSIQAPDPGEIILELIKTCSGPRGIEVTALITLAGQRGVHDEQVMSILRQLVEEDECYQPAAGFIKLL
jgi:uncharacterized protein